MAAAARVDQIDKNRQVQTCLATAIADAGFFLCRGNKSLPESVQGYVG